MVSWQLGYLRSFLMGILYTSADHRPYSNETHREHIMNRMWQTSRFIDPWKIPAVARTWALFVLMRLRGVTATRMALIPHVE